MIDPFALDEVFGTWGSALIAGIMALGLIAIPAAFLYAVIVNPAGSEAERRAQIRMEARSLWLAECDRPIDACARSWDEIPTLRHLYAERVDATRKSD